MEAVAGKSPYDIDPDEVTLDLGAEQKMKLPRISSRRIYFTFAFVAIVLVVAFFISGVI